MRVEHVRRQVLGDHHGGGEHRQKRFDLAERLFSDRQQQHGGDDDQQRDNASRHARAFRYQVAQDPIG